MSTNKYGINTFIKEVDTIVEQNFNENEIIEKVKEQMALLLKEDDILPNKLMQPNPNYALYPIHIGDNGKYSIAVAIWDIGQKTPIHDHGTWGVIGVIQGTEREIKYDKINDDLVEIKDRLIYEGEIGTCCTSDQDIHRVECASSVPCVGIHVYGRDIGSIERHLYDPNTGEKRIGSTPWVTPEN